MLNTCSQNYTCFCRLHVCGFRWVSSVARLGRGVVSLVGCTFSGNDIQLGGSAEIVGNSNPGVNISDWNPAVISVLVMDDAVREDREATRQQLFLDDYDVVGAHNEWADAKVRLQACTFSKNTPATTPILLADNRGAAYRKAMFFSDLPAAPVCVFGRNSTGTPPPCKIRAPGGLLESGRGFLSGSNTWLLQVQQVCSL